MSTNYTTEEFHELQQLAYDNAFDLVNNHGTIPDRPQSYEQWKLMFLRLQYAESMLQSYIAAGMRAKDLKTNKRND